MSCLLAGLSICWFNTVCFVLCIRHFPDYRSLALSLTVSFNGISAPLYTLAANAINGSPSSYLLLNAVVPVLTSLTVLLPILRHPTSTPSSVSPHSPNTITAHRRDAHVFVVLNAIAFLTGIYLLLLSPTAPNPYISRIHLSGAVILLSLPLAVPGIVIAREWAHRTIYYSPENSDDNDLQNELINGDGEANDVIKTIPAGCNDGNDVYIGCLRRCINDLMKMDPIVFLGEEHGAKSLIRRLDFWIYYITYFCGGTVGLVYSNNLGQIAQSLGRQSQTSMLVNVYSSCSFFGRLISAAPDLLSWFAPFSLAVHYMKLSQAH